MAQYIDKDRVVAEIKNRRDSFYSLSKSCEKGTPAKAGFYAQAQTLEGILSFLDTLEVKEWDNIWHDASETPKGAGDKEILVQFADSHASVFEIDDWEYLDHQTKWAYLKDLI